MVFCAGRRSGNTRKPGQLLDRKRSGTSLLVPAEQSILEVLD